jgi:hypothetical protein
VVRSLRVKKRIVFFLVLVGAFYLFPGNYYCSRRICQTGTAVFDMHYVERSRAHCEKRDARIAPIDVARARCHRFDPRAAFGVSENTRYLQHVTKARRASVDRRGFLHRWLVSSALAVGLPGCVSISHGCPSRAHQTDRFGEIDAGHEGKDVFQQLIGEVAYLGGHKRNYVSP